MALILIGKGMCMSELHIGSYLKESFSLILNTISDSWPILFRSICVTAALTAIMWLTRYTATTILSTSLLQAIPLYAASVIGPVILLKILMPAINYFLRKVVLPQTLTDHEILSLAHKHHFDLSIQVQEVVANRLRHSTDRIKAINNYPTTIPESENTALWGAACTLTTAYIVAPIAINGVAATAVTTVAGAHLGNFVYQAWMNSHKNTNAKNLQIAIGIPANRLIPA